MSHNPSMRNRQHEIGSRHPPGYLEIDELSGKPAEHEAWATFTVNVLKIPGWNAPAVQEIVRQRGWRNAGNPIGFAKTASIREANAMGLRDDGYKAPRDRSRRCPCGYTTQAKALVTGHTCTAGDVGCIADIKIPDAA
jgi:hypothetical protein